MTRFTVGPTIQSCARWLLGLGFAVTLALAGVRPAEAGQASSTETGCVLDESGTVRVARCTVLTSVALGSIVFPPDLARPDGHLVIAERELTAEIIDQMVPSGFEIFGVDLDLAPLLGGLPTQSNLEFLTSGPLYDNAAQQTVDMAPEIASGLSAETCGTFAALGFSTFTGRRAFSLYGGPLPSDPSIVVVGTAEIDFYTVRIEVTRVSDTPCQPLEHFLTYDSKVSPGQPPLPPPPVVLDDPFADTTASFQLRKLELLANPVDKNGEGVGDADAHLLGYRVKPLGDQPETMSGIRIENQLGSLVLDVRKPRLLLTPAAKRHLPIGGDLPPVPASLDHFLCYDAKPAGQQVDAPATSSKSAKSTKSRKSRKRAGGLELLLADQFTGPVGQTYELRQPRLLCSPVAKTVTGPDGPVTAPIGDPDTHLVCYDVKPLPVYPPHSPFTVWTRDQFGDRLVETRKEHHLCVPSTATRIAERP